MDEVGFVKTFGYKSGGFCDVVFTNGLKTRKWKPYLFPKPRLGLDKFRNGIRNSSEPFCKGSVQEVKRPPQGRVWIGIGYTMPVFRCPEKQPQASCIRNPLK